MSMVRLSAPLAGWAMSLDDVPDPVFAERMMGDGIAIDPLDEVLRAPCDAEIVSIAETGHSVTLRIANDAELLIHIGLETVTLRGQGFEAHVRSGDQVLEGQKLISFDAEAVSKGAESLVTPVVIASEGYAVTQIASGCLVRTGEPLMEVSRIGQIAGPEPTADCTAQIETLVPMANGLHARPAAKIAAALKPFQAQVRFTAHGREANARSPVALLTLGLKQGDPLVITGNGADARAAVSAVGVLIESGMGEATASPSVAAPRVPSPVNGENTGPLFRGVRAAPGLSAGPLVQWRVPDIDVPEVGAGLPVEAAALAKARQELGVELDEAGTGPGGDIAAAHRALLDDPELIGTAHEWLSKGKSAAFAWRAATRTQAEAIRRTGDPLLIERVDDLIDIERQLIGRLLKGAAPAVPALPEDAILVARNLLPSQFLALPPGRVAGIVTAEGGPTSHVAILAASAGVPMLVAAGSGVLDLSDGRAAVLDADGSVFDSDPKEEGLRSARERVQARRTIKAADAEAAASDCLMADGTRIEIFANFASPADAAQAVSLGAEGCGLLRTEFLFLDRSDAPSEEEQRAVYAQIAEALDGRPLIVRTLDIGGDKPVPYLPFPREDNPALGQRGVRFSLARPDLLAAQLRAILSAVPAHQCRVMVPMIVDLDELRAVRWMFDEAARAVGAAGTIPLGVMIETPSAALLSASLASEADFLSVGTNDLSQYALAADRGNPAVADRIDALHPAVLRLIAEAAKGASAHGRWLGICGGLASDPKAAALLIGLGATELSVVPAAIASLKAAVRRLDMEQCRALAARALLAGTVAEVRALLEGEADAPTAG